MKPAFGPAGQLAGCYLPLSTHPCRLNRFEFPDGTSPPVGLLCDLCRRSVRDVGYDVCFRCTEHGYDICLICATIASMYDPPEDTGVERRLAARGACCVRWVHPCGLKKTTRTSARMSYQLPSRSCSCCHTKIIDVKVACFWSCADCDFDMCWNCALSFARDGQLSLAPPPAPATTRSGPIPVSELVKVRMPGHACALLRQDADSPRLKTAYCHGGCKRWLWAAGWAVCWSCVAHDVDVCLDCATKFEAANPTPALRDVETAPAAPSACAAAVASAGAGASGAASAVPAPEAPLVDTPSPVGPSASASSATSADTAAAGADGSAASAAASAFAVGDCSAEGLRKLSDQELEKRTLALEAAFKAHREEQQRRAACVVCLDARKSVVLMPCRHLCVCAGCAEPLRNCPVCRSDIAERMRLFS